LVKERGNGTNHIGYADTVTVIGIRPRLIVHLNVERAISLMYSQTIAG